LRWITCGAPPCCAGANQSSLDKVAIEPVGTIDLRLVDHKRQHDDVSICSRRQLFANAAITASRVGS
jgi:hypothetical protein